MANEDHIKRLLRKFYRRGFLKGVKLGMTMKCNKPISLDAWYEDFNRMWLDRNRISAEDMKEMGNYKTARVR